MSPPGRTWALGELVRAVREHVPVAGKGEEPVGIGLQDVLTQELRIGPSRSVLRGRRLRVAPGDLLFGALRPERRRLALVKTVESCSTEFLVLRPREKVPPMIALAALARRSTLAAATQRADGTRMPRITWARLHEFPVDLPPRVTWPTLTRLLTLLDERLATLHQRDIAERAWLRAAGAVAWAHPQAGAGPRVGDIAAIRGPPHPRGSLASDVASVRVADLSAQGLAAHTWGAPGSSSHVPVRRGDLLVSAIRPGRERLAISPESGVAPAEVWPLVIEPRWRATLVCWLLQPSTWRRWRARARGGRTPRLPREALLQSRLPAAAPLEPALGAVLDRAAWAPHYAAELRTVRDHAIEGALVPRDPTDCTG